MNNCSIIIPHYNNESIIINCLKSLYKHTPSNHEIIVIDNNSSDNSINAIKENFDQTTIVKSDTNLGYAGGCNLGAKKAKNDFLIFLNNDTEVTENWITPLINSLKDETISSVQPKIKSLNDKHYFDYAGGSGGFIDIFCYPFCRGRVFNTNEKDNNQYDTKKEIFWASGTCFATKKEVFTKSGMFDETLFAHMEEIDYHWRSQMLGYKILANPESTIYHKGGETLSYNSTKKTFLNHRNSLIIFFSNHNLKNLLLLSIPRLLLHFTSILFDLLSLKPLHSIAQLKSLNWIIINIPYIIKRRAFNKHIQKKSYELIGMYKLSIVFNYFLLNKKKFSDY